MKSSASPLPLRPPPGSSALQQCSSGARSCRGSRAAAGGPQLGRGRDAGTQGRGRALGSEVSLCFGKPSCLLEGGGVGGGGLLALLPARPWPVPGSHPRQPQARPKPKRSRKERCSLFLFLSSFLRGTCSPAPWTCNRLWPGCMWIFTCLGEKNHVSDRRSGLSAFGFRCGWMATFPATARSFSLSWCRSWRYESCSLSALVPK